VKKLIPWLKPEGRADWRSFRPAYRQAPLSSQHYVPTSLNHVCLSPWTMTQNLKERILKLRKSARTSGPKAVKANFFTASEALPLGNGLIQDKAPAIFTDSQIKHGGRRMGLLKNKGVKIETGPASAS
jgi:hypothetical protein